MTKSNAPPIPSVDDPAPPTLGVGRPEAQRVSRSVEQLLNLQRIGIVMIPDLERPEEAWGVLNPASARSHDGELYLFPRAVAKENYSRITMAAVRFNGAGDPVGVERLGLVLEPQESYEFAGPNAGGVEDPRITYLPLLDTYFMTYTALGPLGARIALAASKDLHRWDRLGLLQFDITSGVDFNRCDNKDCVIFPLPVTDPAGRAAFALLHRPIYLVPNPDGSTEWVVPPGVTDRRPSIWISYVPVDRVAQDIQALTRVGNHQLLAQPINHWDYHHIGAGAPPILSEEGWLVYYHGVVDAPAAGPQGTPGGLIYQTGVMLLDRNDPRRVLYRSSRPILRPQRTAEHHGIVPNVVFPTAVDVRGHRIDVYYGAADERIAAAKTEVAASVLLAPSAPPPADAHRRVVVPGGIGDEQQADGSNGGISHPGVASLDDLDAAEEIPDLSAEPAGGASHRSDHMPRSYQRILVALDGSRFAERVLASVEPLARTFGSSITLLQVVTPILAPTPAEVSRGPVAKRSKPGVLPSTEDTRRDGVNYLTAVQQHLDAQGLTVESECLEGPASDVILERARQLGADLIAITTHGRTGVARMLLGSVAEDVMRRAPCAVLLVRVQVGGSKLS